MNGTDFLALLISCLKRPGKRDRIDILRYVFESGFENIRGRSDAEKMAGSLFRMEMKEILGASEEAVRISDECELKEIGIVSFLNPEYPPLLREIYSPPSVLYVKGVLPDCSSASLAVVGTRSASRKTLSAAYEASFYTAENRVPVISGLAYGIDSKAHAGAADAGGITSAVLGSGVDVVYPSANQKLAEKIIGSGGSLVSEYRPGTLPAKYHFPERNRIISGISRGTLVVHAPEKSGSLITASFALDQGRDVFVHRAGIDSESGRGGQNLADEGAVIVDSSSEILEQWGVLNKPGNREYRFEDNIFTLKENEFSGTENNKKELYNRRIMYA